MGLGKIFFIAAKMLTEGHGREIRNNYFADFYDMVNTGQLLFINDFIDCYEEKMMRFDFTDLIVKITQLLDEKGESARYHIAASFYEAYAQLIVRVIAEYKKKYSCEQIHVCGGISNNARLLGLLKEQGLSVLEPEEPYKYDNAVMIAYTAYLEKNGSCALKVKKSVYKLSLLKKLQYLCMLKFCR
jgi:tRNA A37 threonylcarbamoyltransferase TsaD